MANSTYNRDGYAGNVGGITAVVSDQFTRPSDTTAYNVGDLVANSTTAGSVSPLILPVARIIDKSVAIRRVRLKKTGISIISAQFRAHFYKSSPTASNGDNGSWLTTESTYLGSFDITMDRVFSNGAKGIGVPSVGSELILVPNTGSLNVFALIEARGAYTPVSAEEFTLTAEAFQD
jgi:hypothetical protein